MKYYGKRCYALVSHFHTVNRALISLRPKMAVRYLQIGQMETVKVSVVIRGHGYKLFTAFHVPLLATDTHIQLKCKKFKTQLVKATIGVFLLSHFKCAITAIEYTKAKFWFNNATKPKTVEKI